MRSLNGNVVETFKDATEGGGEMRLVMVLASSMGLGQVGQLCLAHPDDCSMMWLGLSMDLIKGQDGEG